MRAQTEAAVRAADVALFMIDAREGLTPIDEEIGRWLRAETTPVVVVANKAEGMSESPLPWSSSTLPISAFVTPRATPIRRPFTSRPKMVPAQCVPCPGGEHRPTPEGQHPGGGAQQDRIVGGSISCRSVSYASPNSSPSTSRRSTSSCRLSSSPHPP